MEPWLHATLGPLKASSRTPKSEAHQLFSARCKERIVPEKRDLRDLWSGVPAGLDHNQLSKPQSQVAKRPVHDPPARGPILSNHCSFADLICLPHPVQAPVLANHLQKVLLAPRPVECEHVLFDLLLRRQAQWTSASTRSRLQMRSLNAEPSTKW